MTTDLIKDELIVDARGLVRALDPNQDGRSGYFQMGVVLVQMSLHPDRKWTLSTEDIDLIAAETGYCPKRVSHKMRRCKVQGVITEDGTLDVEFPAYAEETTTLELAIALTLDVMRALGEVRRVESKEESEPEFLKWYPQ